MLKIKTKAFTLAEVLLVLLIIGVVAALTIPSIISTTEDLRYRSAWKKTFSTLSQATNLILSDNSGDLKNVFWDGNSLLNVYENYLTVSKECRGNYLGNCWNNDGVIKDKSGAIKNYLQGSRHSGVILNDGTFVRFWTPVSDCTNVIGNITNRCGDIIVDLNGFSPPNVVGRDIYGVHILQNKLVPKGSNEDGFWGDCDTVGTSCSTEYLK